VHRSLRRQYKISHPLQRIYMYLLYRRVNEYDPTVAVNAVDYAKRVVDHLVIM
jgi:hypothetical protein